MKIRVRPVTSPKVITQFTQFLSDSKALYTPLHRYIRKKFYSFQQIFYGVTTYRSQRLQQRNRQSNSQEKQFILVCSVLRLAITPIGRAEGIHRLLRSSWVRGLL